MSEARRILSSTVGSKPLGKFFTLSDSSTAYQHIDSHHYDPVWPVLNIELLHFYYTESKLWIAGAATAESSADFPTFPAMSTFVHDGAGAV